MSRYLRAKERWIQLAELVAIALLIVVAGEFFLSRSLYREVVFDGEPLKTLSAPEEGDKIVIFAPHEDDELLGAGSYIQRAVEVGAKVKVVLMTNGEYPEISTILAERTINAKPAEFIKLGYTRQKETLEALSMLGLDSEDVIFLGYPDHTLNQLLSPSHWFPEDALMALRTQSTSSPYENSFTESALHCGLSVYMDVRSILAYEQPDIVMSVHPYDVHIDHWATYAFVNLAINDLKAEDMNFASRLRHFNYIIHRPNWPFPRGRRPLNSLVPPKAFTGLDHTDWYAFPASIAEVLLKQRALWSYKTQMPSYSPFLSSFIRSNELFGEVAPALWFISSGAASVVLPKEVIADPNIALRNPGADIKQMKLYYFRDSMMAEIETAGKITSTASFELGIVTTGGGLGNLNFSYFRFGNGIARGDYIDDEKRLIYKPGEISSHINESMVTVEFPWNPAWEEGSFLIWCRSFVGLRNIDQSMVYSVEFRK